MLTSEAISPDKVREIIAEDMNRSLGRAQAMVPDECGLTVQAEHGVLALRVVRPGVVRIKLFTGSAHTGELNMDTTVAVLPAGGADERAAVGAVSETEAAYVFATDDVRIEVAKADCGVQFKDPSGRLISAQAGLAWSEGGAVTGTFAASREARYYGLGEKTGFLDKRGERYEMWNSDVYAPHVPDIEALYQSIPWLVVHHPAYAWGLFLDNPGRSFFDMRSAADAVTIRTETGSFDYYFVCGPQLKDVLRRYASLTGHMALPPRWAIGYHQSRYSYMSQEEVLELARTFREKDIPCDVIYLDIHYMDGYRVFTFDPERFPDPAAMIAELKEMGIRIVPIVDPGVKMDLNYDVFKEGAAENYFCKRKDGEPFVGPVWPGMSVFPDFTEDRASAWWGNLHRFYTELGIEGIWNDMNEPSVFNEAKTMDGDTVHGNNGSPVTHEEIHNLYGMLMSKATVEGLERHLDGKRPFVVTRAGYAGIQRYAAVWTGDNRSYWEHMAMAMPMVLNLGLSGVAFAGPDIGGFAHHANGELLARWTQMGSLFPFCRNHSELRSIPQEPWRFGPEVEAICRDYIRLRYRLMPLLYSVFREAAETGLPVIRPLVLEYPSDARTANLSDQFMLGHQLLAAPIIRPGTDHSSVYLPEGTWFDYWTGEKLAGGRPILAHAPLDRMPLYVKAGAVIPHAAPASSAMADDGDVLDIDIYYPDNAAENAAENLPDNAADTEPGNAANVFELYEDDGHTFAYRQGVYNLFRFEVAERAGAVELRIRTDHAGYGGSFANWRLRFRHLPFVPRALAGMSCEVNASRDGSGHELTVHVERPAGEMTLVIQPE